MQLCRSHWEKNSVSLQKPEQVRLLLLFRIIRFFNREKESVSSTNSGTIPSLSKLLFRRSTKENYCMKFLNTSGMPGMCHRLFNKPIWRDWFLSGKRRLTVRRSKHIFPTHKLLNGSDPKIILWMRGIFYFPEAGKPVRTELFSTVR